MTVKLTTPRLTITGPQGVRGRKLHRYFIENADHFAQGGGDTPASVWSTRQRLAAQKRLWQQGRGYRFYGFREGEMVLDLGLSNVVRGAFQASHLGYRTAKAYEGQGLMTEALGAVVDYAFNTLKLHRLMANYQPWNVASGRVLEKAGFEREGLAKDYLFIDGQWRDHILTALTNKDW